MLQLAYKECVMACVIPPATSLPTALLRALADACPLPWNVPLLGLCSHAVQTPGDSRRGYGKVRPFHDRTKEAISHV